MVEATDIYCSHAGEHDLSEGVLTRSTSAFRGPNVYFARSVEESNTNYAQGGIAAVLDPAWSLNGSRVRKQGLDQRCLANAGFSRNKEHLPLALQRGLEGVLQPRQLCLSTHQGRC